MAIKLLPTLGTRWGKAAVRFPDKISESFMQHLFRKAEQEGVAPPQKPARILFNTDGKDTVTYLTVKGLKDHLVPSQGNLFQALKKAAAFVNYEPRPTAYALLREKLKQPLRLSLPGPQSLPLHQQHGSSLSPQAAQVLDAPAARVWEAKDAFDTVHLLMKKETPLAR